MLRASVAWKFPIRRGKAARRTSRRGDESLAGLAQMNVLEVHPWDRRMLIWNTDRIVFDLDPDEAVSGRPYAQPR